MSSYIIRANDSIQRLAAKFYGNWTIWRLILDINPQIEDWANLKPGIRIEIPEPFVDTIDHTVVEGDSYESLSMLYYGSEHFSNLIRFTNNYIIIYEIVGQKITIPSLVLKIDYTKAQKRIL